MNQLSYFEVSTKELDRLWAKAALCDELAEALQDMVDHFEYTDESQGQYESAQRGKAALTRYKEAKE